MHAHTCVQTDIHVHTDTDAQAHMKHTPAGTPTQYMQVHGHIQVHTQHTRSTQAQACKAHMQSTWVGTRATHTHTRWCTRVPWTHMLHCLQVVVAAGQVPTRGGGCSSETPGPRIRERWGQQLASLWKGPREAALHRSLWFVEAEAEAHSGEVPGGQLGRREMHLIFFPCCVLFFAKHVYTLKHLNKPGDKLTQTPGKMPPGQAKRPAWLPGLSEMHPQMQQPQQSLLKAGLWATTWPESTGSVGPYPGRSGCHAGDKCQQYLGQKP